MLKNDVVSTRTEDCEGTYQHSDNLEVIGYLDLDFARYADARKFTLGYIFLLTFL